MITLIRNENGKCPILGWMPGIDERERSLDWDWDWD